MKDVEIIIPGRSDGDMLADGLRALTEAMCEKLSRDEGYGLGGEFGYGTNYENDTFLMHRYCWCERDDCPWCAGCREEFGSAEHTDACFQSHLDPLREKYGEKTEWGYYVSFMNEEYRQAKLDLCVKFGVEPTPYEWLCTCDGDKRFKEKVDACQCDWHLGKGPFKYGAAVQAPNFWHKPSGLKVRWYKWIGRDMEIDGSVPDIQAMLNECLNSVEPAR